VKRLAYAEIRRAWIGVVLAILALAPVASRADTVASLLGNFTINQYGGLKLADDALAIRYTVVFGQLPALRELHAADANGDGVTSQEERDSYVAHLAPSLADGLKVLVDGVRIPLKATRWTTSLPTEQGGFSLRLDVDFSGPLPRSDASGKHTLVFSNQNYPGRFGWQEIVVEASPSTTVFDTDAFSTSLTADLTEALSALPASGPLSERSARLEFTSGALPSGARLIQPRPDDGSAKSHASSPATTTAAPTADSAWLQRATRQLIDLISTRDVAPHIALLALLAATILGALHAFSPGHGKTVVGAYLIGSRATWRHAVFLGITVTITHTLGVFALGFATLFASRFVTPERLFPILSLLSGVLVLGMGIVLLAQRWPAARDLVKIKLRRARGQPTIAFRQLKAASPFGGTGQSFATAFAGGHHHHSHDHGAGSHHHHAADHASAGAGMHSHGGRMHSHLPPGAAGQAVTWRSLLALGVSGGLVPCPSALVLLLAAVALNKTAYGLLLVVAFSVGLAMTLIAVGLAFLYMRHRIGRATSGSQLPQLLSVASAAAITIVGALLCYTALTGG
jgi:nickel/cobalt transporter (NicO) family protein